MKDLPVYELAIEEDMELGVNAVSLVENPAIQVGFVAMSEEQPKRVLVNMAEQILYGPLLIPDQKIFRSDGNGDYYIKASADTIKQMSQRYLKQGHNLKLNIEHSDKSVDGFVCESWVVQDSEMDKMRALDPSYALPAGTWCIGVKIQNESEWKDYIESGQVRGFSLEGMFAHQISQQLSKHIEMVELKDFLKEVKELLHLNRKQIQKQQRPNAVQLSANQGILSINTPQNFQLEGKQWGQKMSAYADAEGKVKVLHPQSNSVFQLPDGVYQLSAGGELTVEAGCGDVQQKQNMEITATFTGQDGTPYYVDPSTQEVFIIASDGSTTTAPDGDITAQDGQTYTIQDGKLNEVATESEDTATDTQDIQADKDLSAMMSELIDLIKGQMAGQQMMATQLAELSQKQQTQENQLTQVSQALSQVPGSRWVNTQTVSTNEQQLSDATQRGQEVTSLPREQRMQNLNKHIQAKQKARQ